jgi:hypothetical protein
MHIHMYTHNLIVIRNLGCHEMLNSCAYLCSTMWIRARITPLILAVWCISGMKGALMRPVWCFWDHGLALLHWADASICCRRSLVSQEARFQEQLAELTAQLSARDSESNKLRYQMEDLQRDVLIKGSGMDRECVNYDFIFNWRVEKPAEIQWNCCHWSMRKLLVPENNETDTQTTYTYLQFHKRSPVVCRQMKCVWNHLWGHVILLCSNQP